eukprot:scaffold104747_cov75-Phaeocystis_antarctica.AAC.2
MLRTDRTSKSPNPVLNPYLGRKDRPWPVSFQAIAWRRRILPGRQGLLRAPGPGAPAPVGGWVPGEDSKAVILGLIPTTNQSAEIEADVQVIGSNPGPPAMYPTKFYFEVIENGDLVQIFAKQLIDSYPR